MVYVPQGGSGTIVCDPEPCLGSGSDVNSVLFSRISRLFSDAKKILLYSQNDRNLEGFKELARALEVLQSSRSGRDRGSAGPVLRF